MKRRQRFIPSFSSISIMCSMQHRNGKKGRFLEAIGPHSLTMSSWSVGEDCPCGGIPEYPWVLSSSKYLDQTLWETWQLLLMISLSHPPFCSNTEGPHLQHQSGFITPFHGYIFLPAKVQWHPSLDWLALLWISGILSHSASGLMPLSSL